LEDSVGMEAVACRLVTGSVDSAAAPSSG